MTADPSRYCLVEGALATEALDELRTQLVRVAAEEVAQGIGGVGMIGGLPRNAQRF